MSIQPIPLSGIGSGTPKPSAPPVNENSVEQDLLALTGRVYSDFKSKPPQEVLPQKNRILRGLYSVWNVMKHNAMPVVLGSLAVTSLIAGCLSGGGIPALVGAGLLIANTLFIGNKKTQVHPEALPELNPLTEQNREDLIVLGIPVTKEAIGIDPNSIPIAPVITGLNQLSKTPFINQGSQWAAISSISGTSGWESDLYGHQNGTASKLESQVNNLDIPITPTGSTLPESFDDLILDILPSITSRGVVETDGFETQPQTISNGIIETSSFHNHAVTSIPGKLETSGFDIEASTSPRSDLEKNQFEISAITKPKSILETDLFSDSISIPKPSAPDYEPEQAILNSEDPIAAHQPNMKSKKQFYANNVGASPRRIRRGLMAIEVYLPETDLVGKLADLIPLWGKQLHYVYMKMVGMRGKKPEKLGHMPDWSTFTPFISQQAMKDRHKFSSRQDALQTQHLNWISSDIAHLIMMIHNIIVIINETTGEISTSLGESKAMMLDVISLVKNAAESPQNESVKKALQKKQIELHLTKQLSQDPALSKALQESGVKPSQNLDALSAPNTLTAIQNLLPLFADTIQEMGEFFHSEKAQNFVKEGLSSTLEEKSFKNALETAAIGLESAHTHLQAIKLPKQAKETDTLFQAVSQLIGYSLSEHSLAA